MRTLSRIIRGLPSPSVAHADDLSSEVMRLASPPVMLQNLRSWAAIIKREPNGLSSR